jgi:glycosyltransferase involved in cell wall biosynthesis
MKLSKIKENLYIKWKYRVDLESLILQLENIRKFSEIIAICPEPTGINWLGVNKATKRLFPGYVLCLPQYFSRTLLTENEKNRLCKIISDLNFSQIIFSGFPVYFSEMIDLLKRNNCIIAVLYHGTFSELSYTTDHTLGLLLQYISEKKINKIGFLKKGMKEVFSELYKILCYDLIIKVNISAPNKLFEDSNINIGVFGSDNFNKNIHNQVVAGLLIKDAHVHVLEKSPFKYLHSDRIVDYNGIMPADKFHSLLASMSINSYISFSEACPQIVIESLAAGVPCLTSNNNGIFDYDDHLAKQLIVNKYDNPYAISEQMEMVLKNREEISKTGIEYIGKLNSISDQKMKEFLNA